MRASTSLVAVLAAIAVCFGQGISEPRLSAEQRPESKATRRESRVIDALNNCIQARFRDIDDRFGVRRIVKIGETPHRFEPESVVEMSSVRALEQARLEVILYVAGTRVMRPAPALSLIGDANARAIIKGPVRVTSGATSTDGPPPSALWEAGRRAMRAFETSESLEFTQSGWTFEARPVRASGPACLQCHSDDGLRRSTPAKIGDSLGVVMYGYRPAW